MVMYVPEAARPVQNRNTEREREGDFKSKGGGQGPPFTSLLHVIKKTPKALACVYKDSFIIIIIIIILLSLSQYCGI
jgi:hypothetical protein